jgi:hypothetical protein
MNQFMGSDHPEAFGSVWNFEKSLKALGLNLAKFKKTIVCDKSS